MHDSLLEPATVSAVAPDAMMHARRAAARNRITVVDDSADFLDLMAEVLAPPHEIVTRQVVHSIADLTATAPDLLVVDLHCGGPEGGLTGWEIVAGARRDPALRQVPIIVCSADLAALREDRISLITYGDVQLVGKPFDLAAFEQLVDRTLRLADGPRLAGPEDAEYPPLDTISNGYREGRPLRMCPHGRVRDQGDHCSRCG